MANDISGNGLILTLRASHTFPVGFVVSQFADDADMLDVTEITVAESAMGANGDLVVWSKAVPINIKIGIIPGSEDDINLSILLENNRVGKGKRIQRDEITMVGVYPNGRMITLSKGILVSGPPFPGVASAGRMKSNSYAFTFENLSGSPIGTALGILSAANGVGALL